MLAELAGTTYRVPQNATPFAVRRRGLDRSGVSSAEDTDGDRQSTRYPAKRRFRQVEDGYSIAHGTVE